MQGQHCNLWGPGNVKQSEASVLTDRATGVTMDTYCDDIKTFVFLRWHGFPKISTLKYESDDKRLWAMYRSSDSIEAEATNVTNGV